MGKILNLAKSIFRGDFLTYIKADKHIPLILYAFLLVFTFITLNLYIEKTMTVKQENEKIIEELKIDYTHKTLDLVSISTRSRVQNMLKEADSKLKAPDTPPMNIE